MNYLKCLLCAVVFVLFTAGLASARAIADSIRTERSYYVTASGNDTHDGLSERSPFKTLAKAVELASEGEIKRITVIGVLDNETENSGAEISFWETDSVFEIIDSGDALITIAGKPGTSATLRGGDGKRVIIIYGDSYIRFENILITGGEIDEGGGIYAGDGASIILAKGVVLSGNLAYEGGGIYLEEAYLILKEDAAIIDNDVLTDEGGGVHAVESTVIMEDNSRISGNSGGGLLLVKSDGFIEDNAVIADNICEYNGGGVFVYDGDLSIRGNSQIRGNEAGQDGGGIWVRGNLKIGGNASISGNEAGGDGGGIGLKDSYLELQGNAKVTGNRSGDDGGGIHSQGGRVLLGENALLADNEALCGGGLCIENNALAVIRDSVEISGNHATGSSQGGGGICAGFNSIIHMTGGEVVNNVAVLGGGAYFEYSRFIFDEGSIIGNKAEYGGGIYAKAGSQLEIGDEANMDNNYPNDIEEK